MTAQAQEELRQLCSDYFHGLVAREAYRERRAALLDAAILGNGTGPRDTRRVDTPRVVVQPAVAPAVAAGVAPVARRRISLTVVLIGAAAAIAVAAAIAWLIPARAPLSPATSARGPVAADAGASRVANVEAPGAFITGYGPASAWTEATFSSFLGQWDYLSDAERDAARNSLPFRAMAEELQGRIRELRALADPDNATSVERFRWVVSFARALGIDPGVSDIELASRVIPRSAPPPAPAEEPADEPIPAAVPLPVTAPAPAPAPAAVVTPPAGPVQPSSSVQADAIAVPSPPAVASQPSAPARAAARPCRRDVVTATPLLPAERRACFDMIAEDARGPTLIVLPAGEFVMGSNDDKAAAPAHKVRIPAPFAVGVHEVSVGEYRRFCTDAGRTCRFLPTEQDDFPVTGVSWQDAADYASWLALKTGERYRLPSEAEWEYAARAGTTTRYPFGDEINAAQAVFAAKAPLPRTRSVTANAFGLRHTVGNVREWVADGWAQGYAGAPDDGRARTGAGAQRVARGGSYADEPRNVGSASRVAMDPAAGDARTGFRILRVL